MNSIAIMQPYLFPYVGYFQLIHSVNVFLLYDNLDYIKDGWINRNRLLAVKKWPFYFTIPVANKNISKKKIRDIRIKDKVWKEKLLTSINVNYKRSQYFKDVFPVVEKIINSNTDSLSRLNKISVSDISKFLNIDTNILIDSDFDWLEDKLNRESSDLLRAFPHIVLKKASAKLIRPIEICRTMNVKTLINPIGGRDLYPKEEFRQNNLDVKFLKMKEIRYQQSSMRFFPRLSIIDVLMNCGKNGTFELLEEYILV